MQRPARVRGFTLVEVMVAGTILSAIGLLVGLWLSGISNLWWTSTTKSQASTTVQQALTRMTSELKAATRTGSPTAPGISIPAAPNNTSLTFYLPTDLDGDGTIIDASGNTEWDTANPIQYTYDAPSQQLRRVRAGQTILLATNVTSVRFDDATTNATLLSNEVQITLTLQPSVPQGRITPTTSTETVKLRN